jgi:hypothetical protein
VSTSRQTMVNRGAPSTRQGYSDVPGSRRVAASLLWSTAAALRQRACVRGVVGLARAYYRQHL